MSIPRGPQCLAYAETTIVRDTELDEEVRSRTITERVWNAQVGCRDRKAYAFPSLHTGDPSHRKAANTTLYALIDNAFNLVKSVSAGGIV